MRLNDFYVRGWGDVKEDNIRLRIEELEAKFGDKELSYTEQFSIMSLSIMNGLREGLIEVEHRLEKIEESLT